MITFFVILVVLMVLIAALGAWNNGPRRVVHDRSVVADRRPELVEEVLYDDDPAPVATSRRVVRRRRTFR